MSTINVDVRALANLLEAFAGMAHGQGFDPDKDSTYRAMRRRFEQHRNGYTDNPACPLVRVGQWQGNAKVETIKLIRAATGSTLRWAYDEACALKTTGRRLPPETRKALEEIGVTFMSVGGDIS